MAWVYILRGAQRYYIGATENLDRRIAEHRRGSNHTTRRFRRRIQQILKHVRTAPKAFGVGSGFESRPTHPFSAQIVK